MHPSCLSLLSCAFLLLFSCDVRPDAGPSAVTTVPASPPNILWLVAEDISPRFAAYGDSLARTPHVDALAQRGIVYDRMFTTSGVCAPSRAAIISGMYATTIGTQHMRQQPSVIPMPGPPAYNAVPPPYVKAFPELLREAGYWTASYRKTDYQFGKPFTIWDEVSDQPSWRNRPPADRNRPFFIYNTFEITHEVNIWPDSTKQRFFRDFIPDTSKLAPDVLQRPPFDERYAVDPAAVTVPPYLPDNAVARDHIARLYDNASRMDVQIGKIMDQLAADGLTDNTIVFFLSDHGDCLPRGKRWVYDSGIHIPLVIHVPERFRRPGLAYEGRSDRLVSGVDLAATVLDLAGLEVPDWMQGKSIFGELAEQPRQYVFAARDRIDNRYDTRRAVRDQRFKYIKNFFPEVPYSQRTTFLHQMPLMRQIVKLNAAGKLNADQSYWLDDPKPAEELYDLTQDPHELNNLATDPAFAAELARFRQALTDWQVETKDLGTLTETEQAESMWPGLKQPKTAAPEVGVEENVILLSSATEGASVAYRLNADPRWHVYREPIRSDTVRSLTAKAVRYGYSESEEVGF